MKYVFLLVGVLALSSSAASIAWKSNPEDGDWANPNNWTGEVVPGAEDTAVFNTVSTSTSIIIPVDGATVKGITFDTANVGAYTFSGGPIYLADQGLISAVAGNKEQTFVSDLVLLGDGVISNNLLVVSKVPSPLVFGAIQGSAAGGNNQSFDVAWN